LVDFEENWDTKDPQIRVASPGDAGRNNVPCLSTLLRRAIRRITGKHGSMLHGTKLSAEHIVELGHEALCYKSEGRGFESR
jgi:hypothetical protein